jgi:hypothetical protein
MPVPVGYVWSRETGLVLDPDRRVQDAIRMIFRLFDRFGRRSPPRKKPIVAPNVARHAKCGAPEVAVERRLV